MECRCYRGDEGRTRMRVLKYTSLDVIFYILSVIFVAVVIAMNLVPTNLML